MRARDFLNPRWTVLALALALGACGEDIAGPGPDPEPDPDTDFDEFEFGPLMAQVNGNDVEFANASVGFSTEDGVSTWSLIALNYQLEEEGPELVDAIWITSMGFELKVGTYEVGPFEMDGQTTWASLRIGPSDYGMEEGLNGTIEFTSLTNGRAKGAFSILMGGDDDEVVTLTSSFDLPLNGDSHP